MDTLPIYHLAVQPRHGEMVTPLPRNVVQSGDRAWVVRMVGDAPAFDIMLWHGGYPDDRSTSGPGYVDLRYVSPGMREQLCHPQHRCLVPNTVDDWGLGDDFQPRLEFALTRDLEAVTPAVWWHEGGHACFGILAVHDDWGRPENPMVLPAAQTASWLTAPAYDAIRALPIDIALSERWLPERLEQARDEEERRMSENLGF